MRLTKLLRLNGSAASPPAQEIQGPWQARLRVAVLAPWFPVKGRARVFERVSVPALRRYRTEAVAGPVDVLRWLAELLLGSAEPLPSLKYGVIALTGNGHPSLTESDRDLFWRAFQVPVFEQFRAPEGQLLASECDAHNGLHVCSLALLDHPALKFTTNVESIISHEPCACGQTSPRLLWPDGKAAPTARSMAASG